ncbi:hypothetical protein D3C81_1951380 [compost metagenome]
MSLVYRVSIRTTCALATLISSSVVISVLHSARISPVAGCTMALAVVRPRTYSIGTSSCLTPAFSSWLMWRAVIRRPCSTMTLPVSSWISMTATSPRRRCGTSSRLSFSPEMWNTLVV